MLHIYKIIAYAYIYMCRKDMLYLSYTTHVYDLCMCVVHMCVHICYISIYTSFLFVIMSHSHMCQTLICYYVTYTYVSDSTLVYVARATQHTYVHSTCTLTQYTYVYYTCTCALCIHMYSIRMYVIHVTQYTYVCNTYDSIHICTLYMYTHSIHICDTCTANPTWGVISKALNSKLKRLFCHVSVKRDVRALSFEL